jgi:hypothetical protein
VVKQRLSTKSRHRAQRSTLTIPKVSSRELVGSDLKWLGIGIGWRSGDVQSDGRDGSSSIQQLENAAFLAFALI